VKSDLRHSVKKYLEAEGLLDFVKLGPADEPSRPPDARRLASFEESLRQSRRFRARVQWICVALLCSVFALQAVFLVYGFLANRAQAGLVGGIGGIGLLLLPTVWRLRRIWIDSILAELMIDAIRDHPPEEAVRIVEMVHWVLAGRRPAEPEPEDRLRILFVASDPTNAARLRLGEEAREIQERLAMAKLRDRFEFHQWSSVRPKDLVQALLKTRPDVVHFSGHGTVDGELCFEDETGEAFRVSPAALADLFREFRNIRCVLLVACNSEPQAKALAEHIEHVVGTRGKIGDQVAIAFAVGFYQGLGDGRSMEDAYRLGYATAGLQDLVDQAPLLLIRRTSAASAA